MFTTLPSSTQSNYKPLLLHKFEIAIFHTHFFDMSSLTTLPHGFSVKIGFLMCEWDDHNIQCVCMLSMLVSRLGSPHTLFFSHKTYSFPSNPINFLILMCLLFYMQRTSSSRCWMGNAKSTFWCVIRLTIFPVCVLSQREGWDEFNKTFNIVVHTTKVVFLALAHDSETLLFISLKKGKSSHSNEGC